MCPITHQSILSLIIAIVAGFVFGSIWYGPLFGKAWATLMGFDTTCKDKKPPVQSLLLTLLGTALSTIALAYIFNHYKPSCTYGAAFVIWIGFYIPLLLSPIAWEGKSWKVFIIHAGFYLLNLQLITAILTFVR